MLTATTATTATTTIIGRHRHGMLTRALPAICKIRYLCVCVNV